ncbi:MAG: phospho-N-acetylmuramoyl-pentapeptide-transferase [Clostridia bacterium]|nr:phospho-N-acetylmuramoyl-pentapeptide-transferase [Clostridia bacterium]
MSLPFRISIQVVVFVIAFILSLISGPILIPVLRRLKFGQTVRDDGPASHFKKTGTPTMGGVIFLIPILLISIYFAPSDIRILPLAFVTLGFGTIGFIDDFIKVVKKRKDGLYANQKIIGLLFIATVFSFYIDRYTNIGTEIIIPFLGLDTTFNLAWLFIPFTIFVLIATTNAVNITDGLDGLAASVTLVVMIFFTVAATIRSEWEYIKIFSSMVAGGCLGFLAYNAHPARVFMGDTGSLALGGAVAAIAVMMKMPLFIIIVGAVYVIETLSVMIQVGSFKLRGKRVFKMAPIHHHFELSGWKETKVVTVFLTLTIICSLIGFIALRLKLYNF